MSKAYLKEKTKNKLSVRDYITMALILVLGYVVRSVIGIPMSLSIVGNLFLDAVNALFLGTVFMLFYTKVNKKWAKMIFGIVLALIQAVSFWPSSIFLVLGGIIAEIIWQKADKEKFGTLVACFTVQITAWYLGNYVPIILFAGAMSIISESYVEMYTAVRDFAAGPMFFVGLAAVVAGCILGAFIGKLLLKKHFIKAGIV